MKDHTQLQQRTMREFAQVLYQRRKIGKPPVLLVGAGISIASGGPSGFDLMKNVVSAYLPPFGDWVDAARDKLSNPTPSVGDETIHAIARALCCQFEMCADVASMPNGYETMTCNDVIPFLYNRTISRRSVQELYEVFDTYLQYHRPSEGYQLFARLARQGYFEWIISTNFDPLVEEALISSGMPYHDFISFSRRLTSADNIANFINHNFKVPRIKLLKIHGDLKTRVVDATLDQVQVFQPEENALKQALISLIGERDLIVVGHALLDPAINDIISEAYEDKTRRVQRLNSVWLTTMSLKEARGNARILDFTSRHAKPGSGAVSLLVPPSSQACATAPESGQYYFDELMRDLTTALSRFENDENYRDAKPFGMFDQIVFACGMTVSKNQLLRQVVAPQHVDLDQQKIQRLDIYSSPLPGGKEEETKFSNRVAPIYFASIMDGLSLHVLNEGLRRNRHHIEVLPVASDLPAVRSLFVRDVCLTFQAGDWDVVAEPEHKKGIRTLSYYLHKASGKIKDGPLKIHIRDSNLLGDEQDERNFLKKQGYEAIDKSDADTSPKAIRRILETLLMLAGHRTLTTVVEDEDEAHLILSLGKNANPENKNIAVPIHRFIPILDEKCRLLEMLHERGDGAMDTRNRLFLTIGGPEHNKLLELFIAFHRWDGGEAVMNQSNYFDRDDLKNCASTVSLYTESFVGGVATRKSGSDTIQTEENRGGWGAFVVNFSFSGDILPGSLSVKTDKPPREPFRVLSIVGMSAPGTVLGLAYVAFHSRYIVQKNLVRMIDIPKEGTPLAIVGASEDVKQFIEAYVSYLRDRTDTAFGYRYETFINSQANKGGKRFPEFNEFKRRGQAIEQMLSPVEPGFYSWMQAVGLEFEELGDYDTHGKLWSLIADRYLVKQP